MNTAGAFWHPRRSLWLGLGFMLLLAGAPHLLRLPPLAALGWLAIVGWRLQLGLRQQPPPGRPVRFALLLLAAVTLWLQFGTLVGREAGAALLVMMLGLKFLELRGRRDAGLLVYLAYFLLVVQLLFSQSMATALYLVVTALVITAVWVEFSDRVGGRPLADSLRLAGTLLLQALPLMLVLFVLFPRIPGPLWNLPRDAHSGVTGLGNEMEPGRISRLARSQEIAFRASFDDGIPPPGRRYWRGPVFEVTDGRRWLPATEPAGGAPFRPRAGGPGILHAVTLEPHGERSLLALDVPGTAPPGARLQRDFQLVASRPVRERMRYEVISYFRLDTDDPTPERRARNRFVPEHTSERVRALAQAWRNQARDAQDIIDLALRHFRTEPFVYTLTPPRLERDPVDEFLFETRRGFCEHYAAAFTLLMRAAGLPARVVTGYLGGEENPVGGYLLVRQSDAHAWSEVWLEGQGWVRVDPTAAVAPERIERSIDTGPVEAGAPVRFRLPGDGRLELGLARLGLYWDALHNGWNQWILGYGTETQRNFLRWLGLPDVSWAGIARALAMALVAVLVLVAALILYRPRPRRDPVQRLYERFCRTLAREGVARSPGEGPLDFARRAGALLPRHAARIEAVTRTYIALRYGAGSRAELLPDLARAVRRLR